MKSACIFQLLTGGVQASDEASPDFPEIRFSATEVGYGTRQLLNVDISLDPTGEFRLETGSFRDSASDYSRDGFALEGQLQEFRTGDGVMQAGGLLRYEGFESNWSLGSRGGEVSMCLEAAARPLRQLVELEEMPREVEWLQSGKLGACIRYHQEQTAGASVDIDITVDGLAFDSPDGRFAAEGLSFGVFGNTGLSEPLSIDVKGVLNAGELLLNNFYVNFGASPVEFTLVPWGGDGPSGMTIEAKDSGAIRLEADLTLPSETGADDWVLMVRRLAMKFPGAYHVYLEPLAATWALDGLEVTGSIDWNGSLSARGITSGDLDVRDLTVVDSSRDRFALTGLNTSLRPGDYETESTLAWSGLLLGRINLGAGSAVLDSEPGSFALLQPLDLDVLGGQLRLDRLRYVMPGSLSAGSGESRFELEAALSAIDMGQLTTALGWPRFPGRVSGKIPAARLENGVLSVDGEIRVEVFDGLVTIGELGAERLFGVLPSLSADIELYDLDLEQLTSTFEFGRIGGRLDGHVSGLRMLDWQPVAFDAWLGTPDRQGRKNAISRQAVNHLTTIGGGGATTALTGPLMRMFNNFSYRRLGLGCLLQNNVCEIRGIGKDGESVLLLEGAGIPKITVRAWNRQVDWPQMVANLSAIGKDESIRVGEAPDQ